MLSHGPIAGLLLVLSLSGAAFLLIYYCNQPPGLGLRICTIDGSLLPIKCPRADLTQLTSADLTQLPSADLSQLTSAELTQLTADLTQQAVCFTQVPSADLTQQPIS